MELCGVSGGGGCWKVVCGVDEGEFLALFECCCLTAARKNCRRRVKWWRKHFKGK